ncbi:amino acid/amide ABC transporter membrane protein 2 (HAAT family) [Melghirimyces profundicolus]|uniref:Amino acid/amide ABC transporter membrane protein 2 (HAAT family) n=1 Tax=Melghirimyces profundicolus TaxID=1242148 RepID=A0A2T6BGG5_9BACL|nr:branched-chain amino acid ABC transporter permease [Melghirimyces profundicolus]PTX55152.1 amino acid/amide ABC transporter membrane protein 2 (HAAT family) [Melghirimyces profundicolus]
MDKVMNIRNGVILTFIITLLLPFIVQSQYVLHVVTMALIWAISVYGYNMNVGYVGSLSLAHVGFFAIGAYTLGLLTVKAGWNFWLAFMAALVLSAAIGFLVGLVSFRTKGHFFAIYTMCVGFIIYLIIDKWDSLTGGVRGLIGIPHPAPIGPLTFDTLTSQYYLVLFFLAVTILVAKRLLHSLLGRTFLAVNNSEELARAIGISTRKNQLLSFVISCFFAGLAGALYASFVRFIGPDIASIVLGFEMLMYLIIGGIGTLAGPLVGTLLMVWLTQSLQFLQDSRMVLFGPVLVLLVIFYPQGIVGGITNHWRKRRKRSDLKHSESKLPKQVPSHRVNARR